MKNDYEIRGDVTAIFVTYKNKFAKKYGLVQETDKEVEFWFEKNI